VRLATWNVNGIRARLQRLLEWIEERSPDVVAIQELKTDDDNFPYDELRKTGMFVLAHCQKGWNGVAVLSKQKPTLIEAGLPGFEDFGARLISAEIGDIKAVSVYVPNGKDVTHDDYEGKLRWLSGLSEYIAKTFSPDDQLFVGGDFNVAPEDIDSYDPEGLAGTIFHTDKERAAFSSLLDWGMVDAFRAANPDLQFFTWWDYRGGNFHKNLGLRIDMVLLTRSLAERVASVWVDRDFRKGSKPSDHAPVIADLS
jgi:exodeoxyribonuclease-3